MSIYGQYDLRGILGDQTGGDIFEKKKTTKIFFLDINDIEPNPLNAFSEDSEEINMLAKSIQENGILHDLVGYQDEDKYKLISGHRRLKALKKLIMQGERYQYHGLDITGKVPITLIEKLDEPGMIGLQIVSANHQRNMSNDEKRAIIRYALSCLKSLEKIGKYEWPSGVRTCTVLAEKTGIAEHFIKDYLAEVGISKNTDTNMQETDLQKLSSSVTKEEKSVKSLSKAIRTLSRRTAEFDWAALSEIDPAAASDIKEQLVQLITKLQSYIG